MNVSDSKAILRAVESGSLERADGYGKDRDPFWQILQAELHIRQRHEGGPPPINPPSEFSQFRIVDPSSTLVKQALAPR